MIIPSLPSMAGIDKTPLTASVIAFKPKLGRLLLCLHESAGEASGAGDSALADLLMELYAKCTAELQRLNRQPIRPIDAAEELAGVLRDVQSLSSDIDEILVSARQASQLPDLVAKLLRDVSALATRLVRP